jgi:lipopolysaccharide/colanic/teichoic acid biosynthesis glycosyltransferase
MERAGALGLLLFLAPLLTVLCLTVLLLSGQVPLVAHRRVGRFGEPFWMLKLRTMWGAEEAGRRRFWIDEDAAGVPKPATDPRVSSPFAQFCRRYSLDELPQLVHVVSGRMSLVGPRPLTRSELDEHYGKYSAEVLSVRPGLTGLWQILGRSRLTYPQRRRLDLFLVRHASLGLTLKVLARSVPAVLTGRDSY